MDHDQKIVVARQQDLPVGATIVKSIAELERDYRLAEGPLSERFMADVEATIRKAAPEPWEVIKNDWTALLKAPEWKPTRGLGNGDAWFEISEIADDDEDGHTWIGVAVGAGESKFGLELMFRKGLAQSADVIMREKAQVALIDKIGLKRHGSTARLFVPIAIDRLRLAKGFEENDLDEALLPVRRAVEAVVAAKTDLDALIGVVRKQGKLH